MSFFSVPREQGMSVSAAACVQCGSAAVYIQCGIAAACIQWNWRFLCTKRTAGIFARLPTELKRLTVCFCLGRLDDDIQRLRGSVSRVITRRFDRGGISIEDERLQASAAIRTPVSLQALCDAFLLAARYHDVFTDEAVRPLLVQALEVENLCHNHPSTALCLCRSAVHTFCLRLVETKCPQVEREWVRPPHRLVEVAVMIMGA